MLLRSLPRTLSTSSLLDLFFQFLSLFVSFVFLLSGQLAWILIRTSVWKKFRFVEKFGESDISAKIRIKEKNKIKSPKNAYFQFPSGSPNYDVLHKEKDEIISWREVKGTVREWTPERRIEERRMKGDQKKSDMLNERRRERKREKSTSSSRKSIHAMFWS